jgi:hypothetical protein
MKLRKNYSKQKEPKIVISTKGKSDGRKNFVSVSAVVEMTYKQAPPSAAELARSYRISERSVRRFQVTSAGVVMRRQTDLLRRLVDRAKVLRPFFVASTIAFDETQEKLSLKILNLPTHVTRSSWHVLVAQQKFSVCYVNGINTSAEASVTGVLSLIRPPAPLLSTGAAAVHHGLSESNGMRPINEAESELSASLKLELLITIVTVRPATIGCWPSGCLICPAMCSALT